MPYLWILAKTLEVSLFQRGELVRVQNGQIESSFYVQVMSSPSKCKRIHCLPSVDEPTLSSVTVRTEGRYLAVDVNSTCADARVHFIHACIYSMKFTQKCIGWLTHATYNETQTDKCISVNNNGQKLARSIALCIYLQQNEHRSKYRELISRSFIITLSGLHSVKIATVCVNAEYKQRFESM